MPPMMDHPARGCGTMFRCLHEGGSSYLYLSLGQNPGLRWLAGQLRNTLYPVCHERRVPSHSLLTICRRFWTYTFQLWPATTSSSFQICGRHTYLGDEAADRYHVERKPIAKGQETGHNRRSTRPLG